MRITFIKPNMGLVGAVPYEDRGCMEPLTFAALAALTPAGHDLMLCDDRLEPIPYDDPTDLVAINTEVYTARRAYEIAAAYRARGVKVVLGGCHATLIPEEAAKHADALVLGDAEPVWARVVDDAASGALRSRYAGVRGGKGPLQQVALDHGIFAGKRYLPLRLTQFSRGCNGHCEYCAVGSYYRGRHRHRPVCRVVSELALTGARRVFFVDDNIVANRDAAAELFRALAPLGMRWISQGDLSIADDPELLELMMASGCMGLVVGFESLDRGNLRQMDKACNLGFAAYDAAVERMRRAGLQLWAAFLLGYDNDTPGSVRATCDWAVEKKFAYAAFNVLMPYPGTALYHRLERQGRLLYGGKWWLHDDYRFGMPGFEPAACSARELAEACMAARLRHGAPLAVLRRSLDRHTHLRSLSSLAAYMLLNPLARGEVRKKHNMVLGYRGLERSAAARCQR